MIRAGVRVHTPDGVIGTVTGLRRDYNGTEVVDVELDGHTYGPGRPAHTYPAGAVWLAAVPTAAAPCWYPIAETAAKESRMGSTENDAEQDEQTTPRVRIVPDDAPPRLYGDGGDHLSWAWKIEQMMKNEGEDR